MGLLEYNPLDLPHSLAGQDLEEEEEEEEEVEESDSDIELRRTRRGYGCGHEYWHRHSKHKEGFRCAFKHKVIQPSRSFQTNKNEHVQAAVLTSLM
eukprot:scaffold130694_cov21-Tisochrysis_lutea.AAC.1